MSLPITIQGTPIPFPSSADSPNWAPALIQFAQAVAAALNASLGPYDIAPQSYDITAFNGVTNQSISGLAFSTSAVRGAVITYAIYRNTNTTTVTETGLLEITYNPSNAGGKKWEIIREYVGDGKTTFSITDLGQVQFSNTAIGGTVHIGKISVSAKAIQQ